MRIVSYLQALVLVYTVTNFLFLPMLTHQFSYILVLGPYFGCWGSLLGPYFTKKRGPYPKGWGSLLVLEAV